MQIGHINSICKLSKFNLEYISGGRKGEGGGTMCRYRAQMFILSVFINIKISPSYLNISIPYS